MGTTAEPKTELQLAPGEWVEVRVFRTDGSTSLLRIDATAGVRSEPEPKADPAPRTNSFTQAEVPHVGLAANTAVVPATKSDADRRAAWILAVVALSAIAFFWARSWSH